MSISTNQLQGGATFLVRGKVGFSRITRKTTDAERKEANDRRSAQSRMLGKPSYPIDKNYTQLTIYDATVMAKDPNNPSIEEQYAAEHLYSSKSEGYTGSCYNAINKGNTLPIVCVIVSPNVYQPIKPEHELARGLDVTMVMRVFSGKTGMNNGVTLDRILVNETPIRYRDGISDNGVKANLKADYGITFIEPERPDVVDDTDEAYNAPIDDGSAEPAPAQNIYSQPNTAFSAAGPVGAPAGNTPFTAAPNNGNTYSFQPGPGAGRQIY